MRLRVVLLSSPARYSIAIGLIAVAAAVRAALNPVWGVGLPYITFYPAVMLVAWLGGLGPGLAATALSALVADYFWISPPLSFAIGELADMLGLLVFVAMGVVISVLNEASRRSTVATFESQQRLEVTLTSIGDGVIVTDANGCITRVNPVAQGLVGWSEQEAIGRPLQDVFVIVHEQTRQPVASPVGRVLESGVTVGLANHTVLIGRDGREIPIDDSAAPIRNEKGELAGVVMIFRDVAERRRAEREREGMLHREQRARLETERLADAERTAREHAEHVARALRESEERLRITFASIGDAVLVTDNQGRITQLNRVGERLTGWRQADAIGRPIQEVFIIVNEETRQPASQPVELVLREGVIAELANHTVLISKAGDEIPIDDSAAPVRAEDGRLLGAVLVFRDITERRQVERERAARARVTQELAAIVESSDDAIVSKNLDGIITGWNRAAEQMYGYAAREAVGQSIRLIIPEELVSEEESVLQRIRQGERVEHFETRRRRKDGGTVTVSITVSPIRDGTGAVIGASKVARDITPRKQAELERAALLESERAARQNFEVAMQQLQTALHAGRMGTWEYTLQTGAVKWSPGLEAIHGYAPGTFPGTFEAFCNEIHVEDRDRVLHAIADAATERRDHHIEYRIVRADGAVRWVEGRGQLFLDASQQPERMVGVCTDITERKQAEDRFRMAVEAAPAAMLMVDQRGAVVLANALTEQLLGYTRDELIGLPLDRLVPPRFRERHPEYRAGFFSEARQRRMGVGRDLYALRKDGSEVPVEIGLSPIQTDEGTFVLAGVTDITERKESEHALMASEAEARKQLAEITSLYHAAPSGLCVFDREFRYVRINPALAAMNGVPPEEHLGKTPYEVVPEIAAASEQIFQKVVQTGAPVRFELRGTTHATGGAERVWDEQWYPLRNAQGVVIGVGVIADDITERKHLEEQRVEVLERERLARADLDRASRLKDEFLAVLSHELRTPLNAVLGYAHLLNSGTLSAARATHALQAIQRNAQAQARLVESLLDLSRVMAGKLELSLDELDVSTLVRATVDVLRPEADVKGVAIEILLPPSEVKLVGDGARLQQVLWNLLSNAVKFTPRDGRIIMRVSELPSQLRIEVTDTGQGISADFLPYVFDRFKQGGEDKHRAPRGLGLGLALVREMVQAHGGTVVAESAGQGQGSTFTVTLPTDPSKIRGVRKSHADQTEQVVNRLPPIEILIVDDEADARDLLTLLLESRGARTRSVSSAEEAVDAIRERSPDLLLADVGMPDEDGLSLMRRIRAQELQQQQRRLPAIAVTAYASQRDRDEVIAAGYDGHVAKPIDPDVLTRAIVRVAGAENT